jgi:hypothetical protein
MGIGILRNRPSVVTVDPVFFPFIGICDMAGATFVGLQAAVDDTLVLFNVRNTNITCALKLEQFNAANVFQKVLSKIAEFQAVRS